MVDAIKQPEIKPTDPSGWWFFILAAFVAVLCFTGLNQHGLFDVDEAIFAQATQEMSARDDWAVPTYNEEPRYHKPPLTYWTQLMTGWFTADPVLMARVPSAIFGLFTVLMFYIFIERLTGRHGIALTASSILGMNWLFIAVARGLAPADAALNFFMLATIMTLLANLFALQRQWLPLVIAGLLCSLALLTKGPIGILLPGAVVFLAVLFKAQFWYNLKCTNPLVIAVIAGMGVCPWILSLAQAGALDFFYEFIMVHNVERFGGDLGNSHSGGFAYYPIVLLVGFFPWSLLLLSSIIWLVPRFWAGIRGNDANAFLPALGLLWLVLVTILFSFSGTKLIHYIVPALPGAALLLAGRLQELRQRPLAWLHLLYALPFVWLLAGLAWVLPSLPGWLTDSSTMPALLSNLLIQNGVELTLDDPQLAAILAQEVAWGYWLQGLSLVWLFAGTLAFVGLAAGRRLGLVLLSIVAFIQCAVVAVGVLPIAYQYTQAPLAQIGKQLRTSFKPGDQVYFMGIHAPSVRLISGVPFIPLHTPAQIPLQEPVEGREIYILEQENLAALTNELTRLTRTHGSKCEGGFCLVVAR